MYSKEWIGIFIICLALFMATGIGIGKTMANKRYERENAKSKRQQIVKHEPIVFEVTVNGQTYIVTQKTETAIEVKEE